MLTWLWLSSVALLFGAEVNSEAERARGADGDLDTAPDRETGR
jgi:uncharacterized BrkB/YihY/UPF0761 family membrane protein